MGSPPGNLAGAPPLGRTRRQVVLPMLSGRSEIPIWGRQEWTIGRQHMSS